MKKTFTSFSAVVAGISLLAVALPVFADSPVSATLNTSVQIGSSTSIKTGVKLEASILRLQTRANQEIDRRITALNKLQTRVSQMKKVSATDQSNFATTIQAQINLLSNLKIKITADTDAATLKADVQSITKAYRIYALILPQVEIFAAADRLSSTTDQMAVLEAKLQARIATAQASGQNSASWQVAITDMTAKIADAKVQYQAAITSVSGLQPDNGDKTVMAANTAALKKGRADVRAGAADLKAAFKDSMTIRTTLKKNDNVSATTTASVSNQ